MSDEEILSVREREGRDSAEVESLGAEFETGQPGARGLTQPTDTPVGEIHVTTNGYQVNDRTWGPQSSVPLLGQHSRQILSELGLDDAAIDALIGRGVVRTAD